MTNTSTFEEELERNGILIYTNRGDSMMPLLRENRDLIHIRRVNGRCRKYDVPLYKRDGDNRWKREYGITDRHILGVLEGVTRDGVYIPVTDKKYRIYVHLWCDFFYLRAVVCWIRSKIIRFLYKRKNRRT